MRGGGGRSSLVLFKRGGSIGKQGVWVKRTALWVKGIEKGELFCEGLSIGAEYKKDQNRSGRYKSPCKEGGTSLTDLDGGLPG